MSLYAPHQTVQVSRVPENLVPAEVIGDVQPAVGDFGVVIDSPAPGVVTIESTSIDGKLRWLADFPDSEVQRAPKLPFLVESVLTVGGNLVLVAEAQFDHGFTIAADAKIAGVPILEASIPRTLDDSGAPRFDIYAFALSESESLAASPGDAVWLEVGADAV